MKLRTSPTGGPSRTPLRRRRQRLGIELAQLVEAGGRQRIAGDVLDVRGEIANDALRVDEAWLLGAGRAKSNELHGVSLPAGRGCWANSAGAPAGRAYRAPARAGARQGDRCGARLEAAARRQCALRAKRAKLCTSSWKCRIGAERPQCRQRLRARAASTASSRAASASEEVHDQIDARTHERCHGARQRHDHKRLVDHYTTPQPHHLLPSARPPTSEQRNRTVPLGLRTARYSAKLPVMHAVLPQLLTRS